MYIEETIESVLSQRGSFEIEYIIVDGGSTDSTISIIKKYKESVEFGKLPVRCNKMSVMCLSESDNGMYDALTKGFKLATGDIVAFINSDDVYLPNAFSMLVDIFEKYPEVDWVTGMQIEYNEMGQIVECILPFKYNRKLISKGLYGSILPFIQQESTVWRRKLFNGLDFGLLKEYKLAGDFYMWCMFSKQAELYIVQGGLGGFRNRVDQASKQKNEYYKEFYSIAEKRKLRDVIVAFLYVVPTFFFPNGYKRRLDSKIIYSDRGQWIKRSG